MDIFLVLVSPLFIGQTSSQKCPKPKENKFCFSCSGWLSGGSVATPKATTTANKTMTKKGRVRMLWGETPQKHNQTKQNKIKKQLKILNKNKPPKMGKTTVFFGI